MNRRRFLKAGAALLAARAWRLRAADIAGLKLGVITDEISDDLEHSLQFIQSYGLRWVEIRETWGEQWITEAGADTVRRVRGLLEKYRMRCGVLASPYLKTVLPGTTPLRLDPSQMKKIPWKYEDQAALLERALARAEELGAPLVRIFSYWRTADPAPLFPRIAEDLAHAAETAARRKIKLVLENEYSCNVGTGEETERILKLVDHPALGVNWDPGNAFTAGERAIPDGFARIPKNRLWHTHVKDAVRQGKRTRWVPVGKGEIGFDAYFKSLLASGYSGMISLETHYRHASGSKELATKESLEGLMEVLKRT